MTEVSIELLLERICSYVCEEFAEPHVAHVCLKDCGQYARKLLENVEVVEKVVCEEVCTEEEGEVYCSNKCRKVYEIEPRE